MEMFILVVILHALVSVHGANEITGSDVLYVNNGETASFKWIFNFQDSAILLLSVNVESNSPLPDIVRKQLNRPVAVNTKNDVYASRTQVTRPLGMNGIIVDISRIVITDEYLFICKVIFADNTADVVNKTRLIVVVAPTINVDQTKFFLTEGEYAILKCSVIAGNPRPLLFQWFKIDANNDEQPITIEVQSNFNFDYNILQVNRDSRGSYICRVKNIKGMQDSLTKILDVRYKPVVTSPPLNRSVFEQVGTEEFSCDADGNLGITIYKWYRDKPTPENEIIFPNSYILRVNDGKRLRFVKPPRSIATYYYCAGQNDLGIGEAKGAYLNVTYVPGDIYIQSENGVINSNKDSNITITCQSDANPPAFYFWYKYDTILPNNNDGRLLQNSYSGDLNLYYLTKNDSAEYKCVAMNYPDTFDQRKEYTTNKKITLNVRYGPQYTNLTVNDILTTTPIEVIEDTKVVIKCISDSNPPAIYNIHKNPEKIKLNADGENSITFSTIKVANEGIYECTSINSVMNNNEKRQVQIIVANQCVTEGLCANFATCSFVNGLETCTCAPEYSGDGLSAPGSTGCRSKCDLACPMYSSCTLDSAYVASCQCNPNFVSSNGACVDVNECLTSGWCRGANTYCLNSIGGFSCECQPNYLVNAATSGRDRSCTTFQSCSIGKPCKCATVLNPTSVPLITLFFGVNSANPATALQYLDIWSDVNVKAYCKATGCDQSMLGDIISNITIYVRRAEEMMNNSMAAMQKVREYIDCNSFEALEPAWWNLYDTLSSQFLIFKQVKRDMDMKLTFMMEESKRCETTNTDWFRKYLEWLSPVKY